ncbi:hypothetical protein GMOD_00010116 [Pyrenophora seminiperda CCB06]|uniref:Uncharacterized protein n=1 Tax=Pyrenophora seminiperda CCB06 TaxID=1302712 RepID=A0A3M7LZY0_9PLEO|nr:hypothetical protein GMOD_00010116 [Pyrenophora seminiperda CCB06]
MKENLRALEPIVPLAKEASSMSTPRNPSPARKESARTHMKRLAGYNITFDHGTPYLDALAQFVKALGVPCEEAPSPHAQAVIDTRRAAAMESESTGRRMMEGHLLFYGECHAGGISGLTLKDQVNLNKDYLPSPPRSTVPKLWGTLPRPQPDSCIGYTTTTEARTHNPSLVMPFSREEDDIAEWCFYSHTYPDHGPSQLETCHVSLIAETISSYLWLHWCEVDPVDGEVYCRIELIESAHLHKLSGMAETRKILHNYIDYAMGERLESIKAALPGETGMEETVAKLDDCVEFELTIRHTMTPSSSSREGENASPTKKLKRTLTDIM